MWGQAPIMAAVYVLSSCCHSALANETLSAEPTGQRGSSGGGGLWSCLDGRNAIGWALLLSEANRVTNQNVSPAEEFQLVTADVFVDGRGPPDLGIDWQDDAEADSHKSVWVIFGTPGVEQQRTARRLLLNVTSTFNPSLSTAPLVFLTACVAKRNLLMT